MRSECRKYSTAQLNVSSPKVSGMLLVRSWNCTESTYFLLRGTACTQEVQDVLYYCSVEVFIKNLILPILLFLVKCTAHFACIIADFFSLPILLKILLANFVKA